MLLQSLDMHTLVHNSICILSIRMATSVYMTCKSIVSSHMYRLTTTYISKLTDDCLSDIFQLLGNRDRRSCSFVCRRWLYVECRLRQCLSLEANDNFIAFAPRLFSRCDSITRLVLRYPSYEIQTFDYDKVLNFISIECTNLKCLKLRGSYCNVSEVGMTALAMNATRLKKLSCWDRVLGAGEMNALLRCSLSLEELSIKHGIKSGAELLDPGVAASTLKCICLKDFDGGQLVESFAPLIIGSKNLRSLRLLRCEGNWDNVLKMVPEGKNCLLEVYLYKLGVTDVGLSALRNCSKLNSQNPELHEYWYCLGCEALQIYKEDLH